MSKRRNQDAAFKARVTGKTNTSERTAVKSLYRGALAPVGAAVLAATPVVGPVGAVTKAAALMFMSSGSMASMFADVTVGPADAKK